MMSEKLKTIKELADELGVSKQGVRYHMKSIPQKELKKMLRKHIQECLDELLKYFFV